MAKRVKAEVDITEGVIWKQLLTFFFPILLGTFFQQLYNTADAIIVGKFVSTEALAAVGGATGTLINLIVGFFVGLSSGATVILAQHYGARRNEEVSKTVHTGMALAVSGGFAIMVLGIVLTPFMLKLLNTPDDVMTYAQTYMRIYFAGMIPNLIYNIGSGILRAVGDSRRPLYFLIASCMVNIVLDVLFVLGFEMGVAGAALATILSQTVSAVLVIVVLTRSSNSYQLQVRKLGFDTSILGKIVKIGLPAGLQSVMYSLSNVIVQSSINAFGTTVMAAWTAWGKMDGTFWMIISAFGIAITTFTGQNFGAGKFDRMKKSVRVCLAMAMGATVIVSFILLMFGPVVFRLFSNEEAVVLQGMEILRTLAPFFFTYICIEIFSGAVRGVGDTLIPTIMTLVGICLMRTIWLLVIAPSKGSVPFTLYCYPITWSITSVLFVVYYFKGGWLKRSMKKTGMSLSEESV
ncbi:MAG: MATE family efflux transporter [Clostridia bacterium]|nr:MATE family efflux transporter [Clostridia bacterium]MBR6809397.1 MATE family efflux transporter [Clostridia bacterium]